VTCVVTGGTIDDMAMHFIEKYKLMAVKISSQHDIRRLCRATNSKGMVTVGPPGAESIGFCSSIAVREVGSQKITIFSQDSRDATQVATIMLRASTHNILNDIERAVDDGTNVIRMMGRDGRFVAGAGAVDIELARRLLAFGAKASGLDQYAIKAFARALEVVPRTLAENAGQIAMDVISTMYAEHEKGNTSAGISVEDGTVKDMTKSGVVDLLVTKKVGLNLSVDAALTILRVDQIIMAKPAGGPKLPKKEGHWDDQD